MLFEWTWISPATVHKPISLLRSPRSPYRKCHTSSSVRINLSASPCITDHLVLDWNLQFPPLQTSHPSVRKWTGVVTRLLPHYSVHFPYHHLYPFWRDTASTIHIPYRFTRYLVPLCLVKVGMLIWSPIEQWCGTVCTEGRISRPRRSRERSDKEFGRGAIRVARALPFQVLVTISYYFPMFHIPSGIISTFHILSFPPIPNSSHIWVLLVAESLFLHHYPFARSQHIRLCAPHRVPE